ncbi:MAG TPA: histidinol dehydrogenase, partial [Gemmatimonadaceae bacterium]|nr:histidinol dehydrogenase [Gemmatimonadaceae bacterium]
MTATALPASGFQLPALRWSGRLADLTAADRRALFDRTTSNDDAIRTRTAEVIARVRREGDEALRAMAREYDGVELAALEVPRAEWDAALARLDPTLVDAMRRAIANVTAVHRAFLPRAQETSPEPGIVIGRRPDPLQRVGVYAPGGRAAYPSSVIMGVAPARVAGVSEIILTSPPQRDTGLPSDVVLAAAALTGVDRVFALGGAGAVAALAVGTASVPRVDRIVGPGNAYVAEAKLQVAGLVAIDSPAGPSELLVIADAAADPELVARELVAQAEHDPLACVVAVVVGERAAVRVSEALARLAPATPRATIVRDALAGQSAVLSCDTLAEAVAFSNAYAPEHLLLCVTAGEALEETLRAVRNAGTVFVGESASVAYGDYMSGANHVLPTGGLARSYSGLSTLDFVRWTTYQRITPAAAASLGEAVGVFADAEGLPGHAQAARAHTRAVLPADGFPLPASPGAGRGKLEARAEVRALPRYQPDEGSCEIDVSDNTNLWGAPPAAR